MLRRRDVNYFSICFSAKFVDLAHRIADIRSSPGETICLSCFIG